MHHPHPHHPVLEVAPTGEIVVRTGNYSLSIAPRRAQAVLAGPDGAVWTSLSLIASVDRTDLVDETTNVMPVAVTAMPGGDVVITMDADSSAWLTHRTTLRCTPDDVRISVTVSGRGTLADVSILGGRAVLSSQAAGTFRSSIRFASVFVPTPTDPVHVVRPAGYAAQIGVVGDAEPGRLHGIFSPPPLCFALGRQLADAATEMPAGDWLGMSIVAGVEDLGFTTVRYDALDGGFLVRLAYEGHTRVEGEWSSPELVLRGAQSPIAAISDYRDDLARRGWAPGLAARIPWSHEPIFCGWGAQCAHAAHLARTAGLPAVDGPAGLVLPQGAESAPDMARQVLYDHWLGRLEERDIRPGTIVIDDRWQADYGTNTVDTDKWPDLRGWIAERHAEDQHVLLWLKAWDPGGLPAGLCVVDSFGRPVSADPSNPAYLEELRRQVTFMVSPDGLDADGFKVDFTQRAPSGASLRSYGDTHPESAVWGIAALHLLIGTITQAARAAKPDALIVTHTVHPSFGDVTDMIRLNDVLERDTMRAPVSVVDQLGFRHAIAKAALPGHPIDTDQWPMPGRAEWLEYALAQIARGVPALYYVESVDNTGEQITNDDLDLIAKSWRDYRESASFIAARREILAP